MKRYRVKYEMTFDEDSSMRDRSVIVKADRKTFMRIEAARRRTLLYGPEPWKAFGREAGDDWCHARHSGVDRYGDCYCGGFAEHTTAEEFWRMKRAELGCRFTRVWIEEREVTRWHRVEGEVG